MVWPQEVKVRSSCVESPLRWSELEPSLHTPQYHGGWGFPWQDIQKGVHLAEMTSVRQPGPCLCSMVHGEGLLLGVQSTCCCRAARLPDPGGQTEPWSLVHWEACKCPGDFWTDWVGGVGGRKCVTGRKLLRVSESYFNIVQREHPLHPRAGRRAPSYI